MECLPPVIDSTYCESIMWPWPQKYHTYLCIILCATYTLEFWKVLSIVLNDCRSFRWNETSQSENGVSPWGMFSLQCVKVWAGMKYLIHLFIAQKDVLPPKLETPVIEICLPFSDVRKLLQPFSMNQCYGNFSSQKSVFKQGSVIYLMWVKFLITVQFIQWNLKE